MLVHRIDDHHSLQKRRALQWPCWRQRVASAAATITQRAFFADLLHEEVRVLVSLLDAKRKIALRFNERVLFHPFVHRHNSKASVFWW